MNDGLIILSLICSVGFFVASVILVAYWIWAPRRSKKRENFNITKNTGKHLMIFSAILLMSVWFLRFSVGYYCAFFPNDDIEAISGAEQIGNSFLHALQTFSMDEDYTEYLKYGKDMIRHISSGRFPVGLYSFYASILNVIAPIVGGAFVFEILAGIFPQVYFFFSKACFWRDWYYFTSLNDQSLALAKSILADPARKHCCVVFTDVYTDDENEESSERLLSAKALGAICLKDDLLHISFSRFKKHKTYIFLSDRQESDNLQTLAELLSRKNDIVSDKMEIYVFASDEKVSYLEDEVIYIRDRIKSEHPERENSSMPRIIPVSGIKNMAQNLFYDLPLFEGLSGKSGSNKQLNLTIFGSGAIGTELFLNAYWFGQMLDVGLNITVVSKEEKKEFVRRIDFINPDILETAKKDSPILNCIIQNKNEKLNLPQKPYFNFRYEEADILSADFSQLLQNGIGEDCFSLHDTDYFIVALGSDEDNFAVADKLRQKIGYYHLHKAPDQKTIISYVIYNSAFCRTLNQQSRHTYVSPEENGSQFDIYMHAFGSMEEIYSVRNIFFDSIRESAERIGMLYQAGRNISKEERDEATQRVYQKRQKNLHAIEDKYYSYRADLGKRLHLYYKAYSAGVLTPSLFTTKTDEAFRAALNAAPAAYRDYVQAMTKKPGERLILDRLAWLEHRRWNAFMRVCGFRRPDDIRKYFLLATDEHNATEPKFLSLKLHPCLIECSEHGIFAELTDSGAVNDKTEFQTVNCDEKTGYPYGADSLDMLSWDVRSLKIAAGSQDYYDYKKWDYPGYDDFD